jgi:hypothetical protein
MVVAEQFYFSTFTLCYLVTLLKRMFSSTPLDFPVITDGQFSSHLDELRYQTVNLFLPLIRKAVWNGSVWSAHGLYPIQLLAYINFSKVPFTSAQDSQIWWLFNPLKPERNRERGESGWVLRDTTFKRGEKAKFTAMKAPGSARSSFW